MSGQPSMFRRSTPAHKAGRRQRRQITHHAVNGGRSSTTLYSTSWKRVSMYRIRLLRRPSRSCSRHARWSTINGPGSSRPSVRGWQQTGRVRDAVAGAKADAQASEADLEAVRLSVSADLAFDYFALRSLDTQKKLFDDSVNAYSAALELLQQQLKNGAIDASAVAQATTQLEATRTQDTDIDVTRAQMQHAIATLVGEPASSFSLSSNA